MNERVNELKELESFANDTECFFSDLISDLGWTIEGLQSGPAAVGVCPYSSSHQMATSVFSKHKELCSWKHQHSRIDKDKALPSSNFYYSKSTTVVPVLIDKDLQHEILSAAAAKNSFAKSIRTEILEVPPSTDRIVTDLNRDERLAIYDYVVAKGKATNKPLTVTLDDLQMTFDAKHDSGSEAKSQLEILAELRDYKRRRPSYRAKNVHITKKSYTEVLSEVIANQTQYLEESSHPDVKEEEQSAPCENEEDSLPKKERRRGRQDSSQSGESSSERHRFKRSRDSSHSKHRHKRHKEHRSRKRKEHSSRRSE